MTHPPSTRTAGITLAVAIALLTGGCAERQLVSRPVSPPGTGTWVAVWLAGGLAAAVIGVLLTLPAWERRGGARVAVTVFAAQTGAVVVTGTVLAAVAVRSWQLIDQPVDAAPVSALLRLSRIDGDAAFLLLMVMVTIVLTGLLATLLALAARFAAGSDLLERSIASAVLAAEAAGSAYALVRLALGAHGWPFLGGALALPAIVAALTACFPRRAYDRAQLLGPVGEAGKERRHADVDPDAGVDERADGA